MFHVKHSLTHAPSDARAERYCRLARIAGPRHIQGELPSLCADVGGLLARCVAARAILELAPRSP